MNGLSLIKQRYSSMSPVEKRIADCILEDPKNAVNATVVYIAAKAKVSDGSVVNFAVSLGFKGFSQMKINLAQNLATFNSTDIVVREDKPKQVLRKLIDYTVSSFESTYDTIRKELGIAAQLLMHADKIVVFGIAHSASVAADLAFRMMRIGLPATAESDPLVACIACTQMTKKSVMIAVSNSGRTRDILECANTAKDSGAHVIALTSHASSPLSELSEISLVAVSKEAQDYREATIARLTQLLLGDCLIDYITAQIGNEAVVHLDKVVEIFEKNREGIRF